MEWLKRRIFRRPKADDARDEAGTVLPGISINGHFPSSQLRLTARIHGESKKKGTFLEVRTTSAATSNAMAAGTGSSGLSIGRTDLGSSSSPGTPRPWWMRRLAPSFTQILSRSRSTRDTAPNGGALSSQTEDPPSAHKPLCPAAGIRRTIRRRRRQAESRCSRTGSDTK